MLLFRPSGPWEVSQVFIRWTPWASSSPSGKGGSTGRPPPSRFNLPLAASTLSRIVSPSRRARRNRDSKRLSGSPWGGFSCGLLEALPIGAGVQHQPVHRPNTPLLLHELSG